MAIIKAEGFKESDQGRDTVDGELLKGAPPFHNVPRFPKALIDTIYNGTLAGFVPFVWADANDDGGYSECIANQWQNEYCAHLPIPCVEAKEPCSLLMYVDVRTASQKEHRPSPTEYHWPRSGTAVPNPLAYEPEAIMVTARVFIATTPFEIIKLQRRGMLVYCVFGGGTLVWPDYALEPHGIEGCSFVQDLKWLLIGWLYGADRKDFPEWYDPEAESIKYQDRFTSEWRNCTHQPNYCSIYSAYHRLTQDGITGELGVKVSAVQQYAAEQRCIKAAEALDL